MAESRATITVQAKDKASKDIKGVAKSLEGLGNASQTASRRSEVLNGVITGLTTAVTTFGISVVTSGIENIVNWFGDALQSGAELERQMIALEIISPRLGVAFEDAKSTAETLGKELRIGVGPAVDGLTNLFQAGLNLEQATELMRRFANEAITGKSRTISLDQAVTNLAFAYKTNNSALGDASGISENFSMIIENGRKSLIDQGVAVGDITEEMAKYQGMIELTNLTLGSAELLTGTYTDKQIVLNQKMEEFKAKIGTALAEPASKVLDIFGKLFETVEPRLEALANEIFPKIAEWIEEDIVPAVEEFVNYMGSDQFGQDLNDIRTTVEGIATAFKAIADVINLIKGVLEFIYNMSTPKIISDLLGHAGTQITTIRNALTPTTTPSRNMSYAPNMSSYPMSRRYASGTDYHEGGSAIVGENGPEVVNLPRGASVSAGGMSVVNNYYNTKVNPYEVASDIMFKIKMNYV